MCVFSCMMASVGGGDQFTKADIFKLRQPIICPVPVGHYWELVLSVIL